MTRGVSWFLVAPLVLLGLSGCKFGLEQRERWRTDAEERCVAEGLVKPSAYTIPLREIDGAGNCGMERPFRVLAFNEGTIEVSPKATLACPITASVDRWMLEDIQPSAMAWFGQPVAKVKQMSSYSCRNMNGGPAGKISEHAFGNAFDIGGFVLADGREITVKQGWKGRPDEQGFLRTVQATGCQRFTTVLGPGYNIYHYDHIHVDLMRRASGKTSCNPNVRPPAPPNLPVFKAPPLMPRYPAPMAGAGYDPAAPEAEPGTNEEGFEAGGGYGGPVSAAPVRALPPGPAPTQISAAGRSPVQPTSAQLAPRPLAPPPASNAAVGAPMQLTPYPAAPPSTHGVDPSYQSPNVAYPAAPASPPQGYPPGGYPTQGYPAQGYPAQGYPAQGYPAQGYPAQPAAAPAQPYPAPAAAPNTRPRPAGVPLPPAGIPLTQWLGLDKIVTGSTGKAATGDVRSFTAERQFASPIPVPEAETGQD